MRAREHEQKRDHALKQDPYFDYAEALLQIASVPELVASIAGRPAATEEEASRWV